MDATMPLWTLEQLATAAAQALKQDYWGQPDRRASEWPTPRAVRYYTTLGLLDRPILRGRTAYYTTRHLLQLVAIKRLQAQGLSLVEIQQRLYGATDEVLQAVAQLPHSLLESSAPLPRPARRRQRFWTVEASDASPAPPMPSVQTWQSLALAPQVRLLLTTEARLTPETARQIQQAARPLLRALHELGIVEPQPLDQEEKDDAL